MTKKVSNFMRYFALSLVLMISLCLTSVLTTHASDVNFNLGSDDVPVGGGGVYVNGISADGKSGYLVYIVDKDGNGVSPDAKLYRSTASCNFLTESGVTFRWRVESRLGGYSVPQGIYNGIAPWNITPVRIGGGWFSNEPAIRAWMGDDSDGDGVTNVQQFIKGEWSEDLARRWVDEDLVLMIEPVYSYQVWYRYNLRLYDRISAYAPPDAPLGYTDILMNSRHDAPVLVGTVKTLAEMTNEYIMSRPDPYIKALGFGIFVEVQYIKDFTASEMSSGYARGLCHAEKLVSSIGGLPAGVAGDRLLSLPEITGTGVGIFAITARDTGGGTPPPSPSPSGYDGTVYTLSATGGSSSSGSGASATTYFGNGSYGFLDGSLYAENCASGEDACNLADSMKRGMSYEGIIPPVVFSGTSYDLSVESSLGIVAGMLTVDPSTFPYVSISSTPQSGYDSYLSAIKSGIAPYIDRKYNSRVSGTYENGTMDCSPVIGGATQSEEKQLYVYCSLSEANSSKTSSTIPNWQINEDYNQLAFSLARVYYNCGMPSVSTVEGIKTILEGTDLMRAFHASYGSYTSALKADGTLEAYWTTKMNEDKASKVSAAGDSAVASYKEANPEPEAPTEPEKPEGMTDLAWKDSDTYKDWAEDYADWESEHATWSTNLDSTRTTAETARATAYEASERSGFTCNYTVPQRWKFKLYYCTPIMQESYLVADKIPISDGPSRGRVLFDEAWKVSFQYRLENNASLDSSILSRMITYLPAADNCCTTVGGVGDVRWLVDNNHIPSADFLLPDASSMDMRN